MEQSKFLPKLAMTIKGLLLFYVLLVSYCTAQKLNDIIDGKTPEIQVQESEEEFLARLLIFYKSFSLIFHVENATLYNLNYLLSTLQRNVYKDIKIVNPEALAASSLRFREKSGYLHVVLLKEPYKFIKTFLKERNSLTAKDVVLFLILTNDNWDGYNFSDMPQLSWAGNVVVANITDESMFLYNICYYCNDAKLTEVAVLLRDRRSPVETTQILPRTFANFQQHQFVIGYLNSFPHMWCENSNYTNFTEGTFIECKRASGIEKNMLDLLSEKLNFSYVLIEYVEPLLNSDKDINVMRSKTLDFIIGAISMTAARAPTISFTSAFAFEDYTFLYIPRNLLWNEVLHNLKPFECVVWIVTAFTLLWFSLTLYVCLKILRSNKNYFSLSKCFMICFKAVMEQSSKISLIKEHLSPFIILTLWWIASINIITAYKSKLWAISIHNYNVEPSDLRQLLDNGYKIVVDSKCIDIIDDVLDGNEPLIREARKRLIRVDQICNAIQYILNNKAALLDKYDTLQNHALLNCSNLLDQRVYSKLRMTKTPIRQAAHSWPLKKGAPYKLVFNILLQKIDAVGLKPKWRSDALASLVNRYEKIPYSTTQGEISEHEFLQGYVSSFTFYIIGNTVACLCFIGELLYGKFIDKQKKEVTFPADTQTRQKWL